MQITGVFADSCPNGIDCDRIYDTDGADMVIRGRKPTPAERAALGLTLPEHEDIVLLDRRLIAEVS